MNAKRIIVLGGGFAGLWSAVGAARKRGELGLNESELSISLVNRDAYHSIRVRNYEADLSEVRVPLDDVLQPIGIERIEGSVIDIDVVTQQVKVESAANNSEQMLGYDRLIMALGSELVRPDVPGLAEHGFDIDTYDGAARLQSHLASLPEGNGEAGQFTVLVVGAGLTGIECATEMPARLRPLWERANVKQPLRLILADRNPLVGSDMGDSARPVIERALAELGIETRLGCRVLEVNSNGVVLDGGERIAAATVVWCAGMRAHPLAARFPVEHDRFGRVDVDEFMRVKDVPNVFAAGDVARAMLDDTHASAMSCQHGRPMGRFAGHNVVCNLLGLPMLPLRIDWYVTVLDLGPSSAVYTAGWDRQVVAEGEAAKRTKQIINCQRIYPPLNRDRAAILAAARPIVQRPPGI